MTTLLNDVSITTAPAVDSPASRKRFGWLPLLVVLFCISYGLMTMLIVEQGATIEAQRALIRDLYRDSVELSAAKLKGQENPLAGAPSAQPSPKAHVPVTQNPSSQNPSSQNPSSQNMPQAPARAPSSQAGPQHRAQSQAQRQTPQFKMPSRPASDFGDNRRGLITI